MICKHCGQEIPDDSRFCPACGGTADAAPAAEAGTEAPAADAASAAPVSEAPAADAAPAPEAAAADPADAAPAPAAAEGTAAGTAPTGAAPQGGFTGAAPTGAAPQGGFTGAAPMGAPQGGFAGAAPKAPGKGIGGLVKILIPLVIAIVVVIAVIVAVSGRKKKVDLTSYVTITFDGYDTLGTAGYEFDYEQFNEDYANVFELSAKDIKKAVKKGGDELKDYVREFGGYEAFAWYLNESGAASTILGDFAGEVTPNENLSNGDEVTYTWKEAENQELYETLYNCTFQYEDVTDTVHDLEEIGTFDPFEGFEITFGGEAPNGYVDNYTRGSDEACYDLSYSVEPSNGLSNGDTVTVTVSYPYADDMNAELAEYYGKVPSTTTKEFTVSGLTSYAASISEIPDDTLESMKAQAEDVLLAEAAGYYDTDSASFAGHEYIGTYFLSAKPGASTRYDNMIYVVFKCRAHLWASNDDGESYDGMTDYYWYCRFTDALITDDGQCSVDLADYETAESKNSFRVDSGVYKSWGDNYTWRLYGYDNLDLMYNQLVTVDIANYKAENNVTDVSLDDGAAAATDSDAAATEPAEADEAAE